MRNNNEEPYRNKTEWHSSVGDLLRYTTFAARPRSTLSTLALVT